MKKASKSKKSVFNADIIRNRDWFGSLVSIHFNKNGNTHNTLIGGLASILLDMFMCIFLYKNFDKMVISYDDNISFSKSMVNFEELGDIPYRNTSFKVAF